MCLRQTLIFFYLLLFNLFIYFLVTRSLKKCSQVFFFLLLVGDLGSPCTYLFSSTGKLLSLMHLLAFLPVFKFFFRKQLFIHELIEEIKRFGKDEGFWVNEDPTSLYPPKTLLVSDK